MQLDNERLRGFCPRGARRTPAEFRGFANPPRDGGAHVGRTALIKRTIVTRRTSLKPACPISAHSTWHWSRGERLPNLHAHRASPGCGPLPTERVTPNCLRSAVNYGPTLHPNTSRIRCSTQMAAMDARLDTCGMTCLPEIRLTPKQDRFAEEHNATVGTRTPDDQSVCLYRDLPGRTVRWIVGPSGDVRDETAFRRDCTARSL